MKVVPAGVQIGGVRVGGLNSEQARNAIRWWYNRPVRFAFYGKHWTVRPPTLGASVDTDWAVQHVLQAKPNEHLALKDERRLRTRCSATCARSTGGCRSSRSTRPRAEGPARRWSRPASRASS